MVGDFPFSVDSLQSLIIQKKDGKSMQVIPWGSATPNPLISFSINENMFSPLMSGVIIIKNIGDWSNELKLNGFDEIAVKLGNQNLLFEVTNVKNTVDLANSEYQNAAENVKVLTIEFMSKSLLTKQFLSSMLEDENFMGPIISKEGSSFTLEGSEPTEIVMKGFDQYLKAKFDITLDANETFNYCYLKKNNISYPWGKIKGQATILQTMQWLAENAVDATNTAAVNYLFWQDLQGYHFRSIESLISTSQDSGTKFEYNFSDIDQEPNTIHNFETISEFDILNLIDSDTYFSWYERILPDYADPYLDFVDSSDALIRKNIVFSLEEEYDKTLHLEDGRVFQTGITQDIATQYTKLSESHRIDDDVYGFYSKNRYNTPHPQEWDYLGLSADSRNSNVVWLNQFDLDDEVYPEIAYAYDKLIKKPLIANREKYVKLKNDKRKWEVYRCSLCCSEQLGGTADKAILDGLTADSPDYPYYFGPTGMFKDFSSEYGIVAAGSFSDVINYTAGITKNNGLSLSYDMNSYPYNQKISEFYNLAEDLDTVNKYIDNALSAYVSELDEVQVYMTSIEGFNGNVDGWITEATKLAYENLTPDFLQTCSEFNSSEPDAYVGPGSGNICCNNVAKYFKYPYRFGAYDYPLLDTILWYKYAQSGGDEMIFDFGVGECEVKKFPLYVNLRYDEGDYDTFPKTFTGHWASLVKTERYFDDANLTYVTTLQNELERFGWEAPNLIDGPRAFELPFQKPPFLYDCSKTKLVTGNYFSTHEFGDIKDFIVTDESSWINDELRDGVDAGHIWCESCLDPISLELTRNEYVKVLKELKLRQLVLNELIAKLTLLKPIYQQRYQEFLNRKAFFISKNPFDIETPGNIVDKKSQLSLLNVKSIKRTPIRGSRYEVLAKRMGFSGGMAYGGTYEHLVFFDDNTSRRTGLSGNHPYYDQKFKGFSFGAYASKTGFDTVKIDFADFYYYDDSFSRFVGNPGLKEDSLPATNGGFLIYDNTTFGYPTEGVVDNEGSVGNYLAPTTLSSYTNRLNIFNDSASKLPSIEKEKIDSFVRIEFKTPIGLDRLADFPTGFIRDAGSEYFLPYIVQLTAGPNGRQTIQNTVAVIGIDPYGFDVAVKKNKTKNNYSDYKEWGNYWWHTPVNKMRLNQKTKDINDMSLWAESSFENELTYFENNGNHLYNIGEDYTEFDSYSGSVGGVYRNIGSNYVRGSFYPNIGANAQLYYSRINTAIDNLNDPTSYNLPVADAYYSGTYVKIPKLIGTKTVDQSKYGSYNLLGSHLHKNTRRSWYDFSFPDKIQFDTLLQNVANWNNLPASYRGIPQTLITANDFIAFGRNDFVQNFQNAISLKNTTTLQTFLNQNEIQNLHTDDIFDQPLLEQIKSLTGSTSIFSDDIERYLSGDLLIYRPGIVTSQVWMYDIFGETEYGLTTPPTLPSEYDTFDNNFAAQFVVFSNSSGSNLCKQLNLKCLNPKGVVDNTDCPDTDPYCNCAAKNLMPKVTEPSYKELAIAFEKTKECVIIDKVLGPKYLGCMISDPDNVSSCGCPEQGEFYPTFLNTIRSNASFYMTPPKTPLRRQAQMMLFRAQMASMQIYSNSEIKVGSIISVNKSNPTSDYKIKFDRMHGDWMVVGINHMYKSTNIGMMTLTLSRDSYYEDQEAFNPTTFKKDIF